MCRLTLLCPEFRNYVTIDMFLIEISMSIDFFPAGVMHKYLKSWWILYATTKFRKFIGVTWKSLKIYLKFCIKETNFGVTDVWLPISIVAQRHSPSLPPPSQEDGSGLSLSLVIKSSKKKRNGWDSETYISLWLLSQLKLVFIEISCSVSVCLILIVFWCASNDFLFTLFQLTGGYRSHPWRCTEPCDTPSQPLHKKEADKQIHCQFHPSQQPWVLLAHSGRHSPLPPQLHWPLLSNSKPPHRVPQHHWYWILLYRPLRWPCCIALDFSIPR